MFVNKFFVLFTKKFLQNEMTWWVRILRSGVKPRLTNFTGIFQILCWIREAPWPVTFPLKNEKNFAKMTHHHLIISAMTYVKWGKFLYKNIFFLWNDSSFNLHILRQILLLLLLTKKIIAKNFNMRHCTICLKG